VAHWLDRLSDADVPAGEVGDIGSAVALADRLGLRPRVEVGAGEIDQIRNPVTFSRTPVDAYRRPPRLGEHDATVRAGLYDAATTPHPPTTTATRTR
jgi:formyl-CoA transferase